MKNTFFPLSFLFSSLLLAPCKVMADDVIAIAEPQAFSVNGAQLTPLTLNEKLFYLVTSKTKGLILTNEKEQPVATLAGHFAQSDVLVTDSGFIVAALNNDTYGVELFRYTFANHAFFPLTTVNAASADLEAVCLSSVNDKLNLITADALGRMQQFWLEHDKNIAMRTVNVGTGQKNCQIDMMSGKVLLADENVGLWQYDNSVEAGDGRDLITLPDMAGIEGVGVFDGLTMLVSPDINAVGVLQDSTINWTTTNGDHKWETIRFTAYNDNAIVGLYDDKTESLYTVRFALPAEAEPKVSTSVRVDAYLTAFAQTDTVARFGDAADDPAIWYLTDSPEMSVILGTDKKGGLDLFDLSGKRLQHLPVGRVNNVDVRTHWQTKQGTFDIAAASNRTSRTVDIFLLDADTRTASTASKLRSNLNDLYGLCMYHSDKGELNVLVNDTDGHVERHRLTMQNGTITSRIMDTFSVPSQPEGCVADDETGMLYYGEEDEAVWIRDLNNIDATPRIIARVGGPIQDDIEGMSLFDVDGERYLIISSQGNHRYGVFSTKDHRLLGTFAIAADTDTGIDGVSETDGLESLSVSFGKRLPEGLLVVQDGHNVMPSQQQNFKLVSGSQLAEFIRQYR